jgi:hypothetical protein
MLVFFHAVLSFNFFILFSGEKIMASLFGGAIGSAAAGSLESSAEAGAAATATGAASDASNALVTNAAVTNDTDTGFDNFVENLAKNAKSVLAGG